MPAIRQPWEILPAPDKGADSEDQLYTAVGAALSQWEVVEEGLAETFSVFVGAAFAFPGKDPAIRAYGTIISFNSRADMLDAAAVAFFHKKPNPEFEGKFRPLLNRARQLVGRRNDIAHGRVHFVPGYGFYLLPGLFNAKKYKVESDQAAYSFGPNEVHHYREHFELLAEELSQLATFWSVWEEPAEKKLLT